MPRQRVDQRLLQPLLEGAPTETLNQLFVFGELMVNEVLGRTAGLDAKAQNIVGWTSAMLAVLIASASAVGAEPTLASWQVVCVGIGAVTGLVALFAGAMALRMVDFEWPSQQDWFRRELFDAPNTLRGYQLLAMLNTHEAHSAVNERKARWLVIGQYALMAAGTLLAAVLFVPVVASWF